MKFWLQLGLVFLVIGITLKPALSDDPPSWIDFEIKSPNGKYVAKIKGVGEKNGGMSWERKYKLTVYGLEKNKDVQLWACDYKYSGYPGGLLSDDGSIFVYIEGWFYPAEPVVSIYRNGTIKEISGEFFKIHKSKLVDTASHQIWLLIGTDVRLERGKYNLWILDLTTIDGKKHRIDLHSAAELKED